MPGESAPLTIIAAPSPNFDFRNEGARLIDTLLVFDTGSNYGPGDIARLRNRWRGVSAHYVVDRDGLVYQLVADKDLAWLTHTPVDERSIGIEIVHAGQTDYPEKQLAAAGELAKALVKEYKIRYTNLKRCEQRVQSAAAQADSEKMRPTPEPERLAAEREEPSKEEAAENIPPPPTGLSIQRDVTRTQPPRHP